MYQLIFYQTFKSGFYRDEINTRTTLGRYYYPLVAVKAMTLPKLNGTKLSIANSQNFMVKYEEEDREIGSTYNITKRREEQKIKL